MKFPPQSFHKVLSSLSRRIPDNLSDITLFNDLPDPEKQAALIKLQELAQAQPRTPRKTSWKPNWKLAIMLFAGVSFIVAAIIASVALAVDTNVNPDLVQKLKMANTNLDRMKLLPQNSDWFFDFTKSDKYTFSPGGVVNANAATFPATVGNGMTMVSGASLLT